MKYWIKFIDILLYEMASQFLKAEAVSLKLVDSTMSGGSKWSEQHMASIYHYPDLWSGEVPPVSPLKNWILTKQSDTFVLQDKWMPITVKVLKKSCYVL